MGEDLNVMLEELLAEYAGNGSDHAMTGVLNEGLNKGGGPTVRRGRRLRTMRKN
jgi:hypothetical protein